MHRLGVRQRVLQRRLQGGLHPVRTTCMQSITAPTATWLQAFGHAIALCTKTAVNITLSHPQITRLRSYICPRAFGSHTEMEGSRLPADLAQALEVGWEGGWAGQWKRGRSWRVLWGSVAPACSSCPERQSLQALVLPGWGWGGGLCRGHLLGLAWTVVQGPRVKPVIGKGRTHS